MGIAKNAFRRSVSEAADPRSGDVPADVFRNGDEEREDFGGETKAITAGLREGRAGRVVLKG